MPAVTDTASIQGRLLFFVFVVAGCALSFFFSSIAGWAFLAAAVFAIILLGNPRTLLLLYAVWITILPYLDKLIGDNIFLKWSDETMAGALLVILLFNTEQHRRRPELKWVTRSLVTLLCLIGISGVVNQVPPVFVLHFCLQYMRWYLVFYATIIFLGNRGSQVVFRGVMFLFFLQVIPNVGWLLGINPMTNWMSGVDLAIGTGLGANIVAYFSVAFSCVCLAYVNHSRNTIDWVVGVGMMMLGVGQLYFSYTVHAYMILVLCIVVQLVITGVLTNYFRLISWSVTVCLLVVMVLIAFNSRLSSEYLGDLSPDYVVARWHNMLEGPKGQAYQDAVQRLPEDIPFPFIGGGPGNVGSNVAMQNRRPLADKYFNWVLLSSAAEYNRVSEGSSVTSGPHTGILTFLSELGPLGLIAFWGIHIYAGCRVWGFIRRRQYTDRMQLILAEAFIPAMLMILMLAWIADYWYIAFVNNMIWVWAAVVWVPLISEPEQISGTVPA